MFNECFSVAGWFLPGDSSNARPCFLTAAIVAHTTVCWCCAGLSRPVVSGSLRPHGLQPTSFLCPGKNIGVSCQGIFLIQGLNPGL